MLRREDCNQVTRILKWSRWIGLSRNREATACSLLSSVGVLFTASLSLLLEISLFGFKKIAWFGIKFLYWTIYFIMLCICYVSVFKSYGDREVTAGLLDGLRRTDSLSGYVVKNDATDIYLSLIKFFIFLPIFLLFRFSLTTNEFGLFAPFIIFLTVTLIISLTVEAQFLILMEAVTDRIIFCTSYLTGEASPERVERSLSVFGRLTRLAKRLEAMYSPHVFLTVSWIFAEMVHVVYSTVSVANFRDDGDGYAESLLFYVWIAARFAQLNIVVGRCTRATRKAKMFNNTLYEMVIYGRNSLSNNNKILLHLLSKEDIEFSVCGFFPLDYTLIHSVYLACIAYASCLGWESCLSTMVAAITTYMVILIQLGAGVNDGLIIAPRVNATFSQSSLSTDI